MKKYRILVITDHHTHGQGESIYELLRTMLTNPHCMEIYLATRGDNKNRGFFTDFDMPTVYAKQVDNELFYTDDGGWFFESESVVISEFDVLFLRVDRPLTDDQLHKIEVNYNDLLVINKPGGIIETGSKRFLLNFPELCPDMALCHNLADVKKQLNKCPIVLKPLHGYGGVGLIKIDGKRFFLEDKEYNHEKGMHLVGEYLEHSGSMLSMRYLKNVNKGDKRVVVVGGEVLGATLRLPAKGSWLCNLKQGGSASFANIDESEQKIADTISPILRKHGVLIFGFDTLENDVGVRCLSEINTLNVGGLLQAQEFSKKPVIRNASELIWQYIVEFA